MTAKLVRNPPTTQSERIYALEEARKADEEARKGHGDRLDKIETMVKEIHDVLVNVRGFKWVFDGFCKYAGQISMVCGAFYGLWKFTGH
jgi:hypothetical protein